MDPIDHYLEQFPAGTRELLEQIRQTIREAVPPHYQAEEVINYGIPTFKLHGNLVHFAGYKNHIGFYPAPSGLAAFIDKIARYKHSKGAVQFPLDEPLPLGLIREIMVFRVKENLEKKEKKGKGKKGKV